MAKLQSGTFQRPDSIRVIDHGRVELVNLGESSVGRQVLDPGWRWSLHVKPMASTEWCEFHHFGLVVAGRMRIEMADGTVMEVGPDAVYEIPPGHDAWVLGDEPWIGIAWSGIRSFGAPLLATGERVLTTVVFTDIVGSTELAARIGDSGWESLIARHNDGFRRAIESFGGREIKTTGVGFLVRFDVPVRALACARAMHSFAKTLDVRIPAAVHTGEVEIVGDDIRGLAVHLASRLLDAGRARRDPRLGHDARPGRRLGLHVRGPRAAPAEGDRRGRGRSSRWWTPDTSGSAPPASPGRRCRRSRAGTARCQPAIPQ